MIETDVLIIGAGIIGCSIAYYLSKKGVDVIIVERDDIAAGASSACDGFVFLQSKSPGIHLEMALESARIYDNLASELGSDLEYRKTGGMVVAETQEELLYLKNLVRRQRKTGLDAEILTSSDVFCKAPYLARHILGATFCAEDAQVNPVLATYAFCDAARRNGVRILTQTQVRHVELTEKDGKKAIGKVSTGREVIKPHSVIDAAGAWAATIAEMINVDMPIIPRRGQILVTEPLPKFMDFLLTNGAYISAKLDTGVESSAQRGVTFEQTASGNLLIGSTREFVGYNKRTTYQGLTRIAANAAKLMPGSAEFKVIRAFAGLRPSTPDGLSVLGPVAEVENFLVASGHEGDGIALAPITGKLMSDLIVEGRTSIDISELSPNRFRMSG
jgi:glycine/D-amino acid oxidase-like deaminating enzyme